MTKIAGSRMLPSALSSGGVGVIGSKGDSNFGREKLNYIYI